MVCLFQPSCSVEFASPDRQLLSKLWIELWSDRSWLSILDEYGFPFTGSFDEDLVAVHVDDVILSEDFNVEKQLSCPRCTVGEGVSCKHVHVQIIKCLIYFFSAGICWWHPRIPRKWFNVWRYSGFRCGSLQKCDRKSSRLRRWRHVRRTHRQLRASCTVIQAEHHLPFNQQNCDIFFRFITP